MGLFKKRASQPAQQEATDQQQRRGGASGDPRLPGLAGYPTGPLPKRKNHMPPTRFTYVRPDGKQD